MLVARWPDFAAYARDLTGRAMLRVKQPNRALKLSAAGWDRL